VEKNAMPIADAASQDVRKVAGAIGDSAQQAAEDVSQVIEGVAKDVEVCISSPCFGTLVTQGMLLGRSFIYICSGQI
jgi:hypothetical protein